MGKTNIQWTDFSWNVARGCTKVDSDCKFCYMYRDSYSETRYNPREVVRTKTVFNAPLKLKEPSKIFTCSLTDFFHPAIDSYRNEAWDIIRKCPQHTFQILTKRPERITEHTPADLLQADNIWFGTSVGSQKGVDNRLPHLAKLIGKCRVLFISFEPLYEKLNLSEWIGYICAHEENNRYIKSLSSGNKQRNRDNSNGSNLENSQENMESLETKNRNESMQKSSGGTRHGTIPDDSDNVQQKKIEHGRTSVDLFSFQGSDSVRQNSESQERKEERQPSEQSGTNDGQRTGVPFEKHFKKGNKESERGAKFNVETNRIASERNNNEKEEWRNINKNSTGLQCEISTDFENSKWEQMETSFWSIIGGESGNETGIYGYRPCQIEWIEELILNLTPMSAIFVKQMGTHLSKELKMSDRHGGEISEFPKHLQIRQFPKI